MIAVDTNILVYAHRTDTEFHAMARQAVESLARQQTTWALPWPCVHEFLGVVTNPRTFEVATPPPQAAAQIEAWMTSPRCRMLSESATYWPKLRELLGSRPVRGGLIHDARIAALCLDHGVTELWTADRDFSRFPELRTRNPLVNPPSA